MKAPQKPIQWDTPCELIHRKGYHLSMEARTKAAFTRTIKSGLRKDSRAAIRFDVHKNEKESFGRAVNAAGCGCLGCEHADELRDRAGFSRYVVVGPGHAIPKGEHEQARMAYTDAEILDVFCNCRFDYRWLWPDAKRERGQQENRVKIAPKGGAATALNSDEDILQALRNHKRDPGNAGHSMTTAIQNVVAFRKLKYENPEKLLARLTRMGKRMNPPKRPRDLYANL